MKIKKNSWHYRLYQKRPSSWDYEHENHTFCDYVKAVMNQLCKKIIQTIAMMMLTSLLIAIMPFIVFMAFLVGHRPVFNFKSFSPDMIDMVEYKKFKIGKLSFYPLHVAAPIGAAILAYSFKFENLIKGPTVMFLVGLILFGLSIILWFAGRGERLRIQWEKSYKETSVDDTTPQKSSWLFETVFLVFEYLKAKKQKVCPLIEFVDDNEQ